MISPFSRRLSILLLLAGFFSLPVHAQQQDTTGQQLPEIAPREIEIRGELQVSFPTLERQPLRGFASPPTIPSVPESHTPYVEPYKQRLESLPESLPTPEAVSQSVTQPKPPERGFMEIGGGRYASRFAEGHLTLPFTDQQTLSLDVNYFGTEGFAPFSGPADNIDTPSDQVDGHIQFESRHDHLAVRAIARGAGSSYTLYGHPSLAQLPDPTAPDRSSYAGRVGLELRTYGNVESRAEVTYDGTTYDTQLSPGAPATATFQETRLGFDGHLTVPLGTASARLEATAARSTYAGDVPGGSGHEIGTGATVQIIDSDRLSVNVGGRFLSFEALANPQQSAQQSVTASFIVPKGRAKLSFAPGVTMFAENTPTLSRRGLASLYDRNPYAEHAPSIRPTTFTTKAASGVELSIGLFRFEAKAGYQYAPTFQYFYSPLQSFNLQPSSGPPLAGDPFQVGYGSARILHGGGQVALQGVDGLEASVEVSVRDGELVSGNTSIPYFSPVIAESMISVSFADQRGLLQTTGTIESPRPINTGSNYEVGTYVSFDVEGSYEVTSLLDLVLEVRNIGPEAPERWARYPRPPAIISGGFRIHW